MYAYDFEVFKYDWLVVFKNHDETIVVHNDIRKLRKVVMGMNVPILVGFNNYHYDDVILSALLSDTPTPSDIYNISQKIINYKEKLFPNLKILTLDTKQELERDISIKSVEAHLGWDIVECSVPWSIDRPLTDDELAEVTKYCIHDVDATLSIWALREEYFSAKINLVKEFNLPYTAVKKTQAGLAAEVLGCLDIVVPQDRLKIDYDPNINWKLIPPKIRTFFKDVERSYMRGENVDKIEKRETHVYLDGIEHTVRFGGLHGAKPNYVGCGDFLHIDVSSYYPTLIINNNWMSRAVINPEKFKQIKDTRFALKKAGDPRQEVYKIILNSTYGAMKNEGNKLFDPKMPNNICINGQIILIQLIRELKPYCRLIQSNTDGLIVEVKNKPGILATIEDFSKRFNLNFGVQ